MTKLRVVAITGSRGFIGSALAHSLRADRVEVRPLVRRPPRSGEVAWDPAGGRIDARGLEGVDAIVHLAGASIFGRWTEARKRRIFRSRADGTRLLAETVAGLAQPPRTFVSASGVGYYGDRGNTIVEEQAGPGSDFLARVCVAWEEATTPAADAGVRVVRTRFGLVLHRDGGALRIMWPLFWLGLGGRLGSGTQWMSWVARIDAVRAIRFALEEEAASGPLNVTAPEPLRNADFTRALARHLHRPAFLRAPAWALRLPFGQLADVALLVSQRAAPARLTQLGFSFQARTVADAFAMGLDGEV